MKRLIFSLAALCLFSELSVADSTTVTASDIEDTYIASGGTAAYNYGATTVLQMSVYTTRGILIRVTNGRLADLVGANKSIDSAFLTMVVNTAPTTASRIVHVFKCLRDWKEGSLDGSDATNQEMASWNQYDYDNEVFQARTWGTAGCQNTSSDRTATQMDSVTVTTSDAGATKRWRLDTAMVHGWYSGTILGGVVLKASSSNTFDFYSTETSTSSNRPTFVVYYHSNAIEEPIHRFAKGAVKARMRNGRVGRRLP